MTAFRYDLHIHSCLSPCGEDDATPFSIAGMAKLNGLDLIALTDHNTCGNCAPFLAACEGYGLTGVPGMELTTAEDVHIICLFAGLTEAAAFESAFRPHRIPVRNRPEIFGRQILTGMDDEPVGEEENLLINASDLSIGEAKTLAEGFGGAVYPAHVDREGNGIIATLGDFPEEPVFAAVEFHDPANVEAYKAAYPALKEKRLVFSSDAHRLFDLSEGDRVLELPVGKEDGAKVRLSLISYLRGGAR
jgi:hypothetical protein